MNIKAVAKHARVSTATVSRTINATAKVNPETAERVRLAIEALSYHPNTNARALGSGRSRLYGLIISDITNPFFPELVKSFEDIAVAHGQEVMIANTNYDQALMKSSVSRMLQRKVDGVAIMTSEMDDKLTDDFSHRNIPLVFFDTGSAGPGITSLRVDYAAGVEIALDHLLGLGHRRIGFLSGPLRLPSALVRVDAFRERIRREGLNCGGYLVQESDHHVEGARFAMERMLAGGPAPTAVMASNDLTAIGALGALFDHGMRVPDDISVVGFDDIEISGYTHPPLTTLRIPRGDLAQAAFRALYQAQDDPKGQPRMGEIVTLQPTLVRRKSTGPA